MIPFLFTGAWLVVTAYAPGCGDSGRTASGTVPSYGTVSSGRHLPFGTRLSIPGYSDQATVQDRGVPNGQLDVWFPDCWTARKWGRPTLYVLPAADLGAGDQMPADLGAGTLPPEDQSS